MGALRPSCNKAFNPLPPHGLRTAPGPAPRGLHIRRGQRGEKQEVEQDRAGRWSFPAPPAGRAPSQAALGALTVGNLVRPLPLLVDDDDHHQDDDLCQDAQEGPQRGQVAAHAQDGGDGHRAHLVGGVALVLAGVLVDLQVCDAQLGVVLFVGNEEAARGVVDVLAKGRGWETTAALISGSLWRCAGGAQGWCLSLQTAPGREPCTQGPDHCQHSATP